MNLEEVVLKAGSAYSEGRYEEALQIYDRAVLVHPHNAVLHANISAILSRLSRHEEALKQAEIAVNLQPKWGKASYRKGEALRHLGKYKDALMAFCSALRYDSPTKQCLQALKETACQVFIAFPLKEMEKLSLQDDSFALLATIGQFLLTEGAIQDSIQILTWSFHLDCSCLTLKSSVLSCLGSAHFISGNIRKAIDYYEQQLEICQELGLNEVQALKNIAIAAEKAKEWELSLQNRRKLIVHKDLSEEEKENERQTVAELLLQIGRAEEALVLLEMKEAKSLRARINLTCAEAATGNTDSAIRALLLLRPGDEQLFIRTITTVSCFYLEVGRLQEAANYIEDIMKYTIVNGQDLVWMTACYLCSKIHFRMRNIEKGLVLAKRLLRIAKKKQNKAMEADALRLLATAYEQQNDFSSAGNCLSLLTTPVEKIKIHLELARIDKKAGNEPVNHLQAAVDAADYSSNSQAKIQAYSMALRHFKKNGELHKAETLLQKQKDLLQYDLDGTNRSIIFEDLAFMTAEEGGSSSSVMALEHSLAEAQEANNIQRELELLERLGDELAKLEKTRESEGFYQRFLALAKQLRMCEKIQKGHEKLAKEYHRQKDWNLCLEHARNALTLAKIQQDIKGRIEMLLLIGEAEKEKNNYETAIYVFKKALGLAEASQLKTLSMQANRFLGESYEIKGEDKLAEKHKKEFLSLYNEPSDELCKTLLVLSTKLEPAEAIIYLKRCRKMALLLKMNEKNRNLIQCFVRFLDLSMVDEAITCLNNTETSLQLLENVFQLPLTKQMPILMYLMEKEGHSPLIHGRLLLLRNCDKTPICQLITAWNDKNWSDVIKIAKNEFVNEFDITSKENLEIMVITANWHLYKVLPDLNDLPESMLLYLHSFTWTDNSWQKVDFIRNRLFSAQLDLLVDDIPLLEKIIYAVLSGQTELLPMWFEELLTEMRESEWSPFPWSNLRQNVLIAAAFIALAEEDHLSQIWILEKAKWELDKHLLACQGLPSPPQVSFLLFSEDYTYVFSPGEVDMIWIKQNKTVDLFLKNLSSTTSFHIHLLSKFMRHKGIKNLNDTGEIMKLVVSNKETDLCARRIVPWIRHFEGSRSTNRSTWLFSTSLLLPRFKDIEIQSRNNLLKLMSDCYIYIFDPEQELTIHEIISAGTTPSIVLVTGNYSFDVYSAFLLIGTNAVVEVENPTEVSIQIFVDQLRMGDSVSTCASHLKHKLYGDPDYRIMSDPIGKELHDNFAP